MANTNASPILSNQQAISLERLARGLVNGVDLNLNGHSITDTEDFVLDGTAAQKNRVLLWLQTKPKDYVREPNKSGPLYYLIGQTLIDDNASTNEQTFRALFLKTFQGDLEISFLKIIPNVTLKRWEINLIVKDPVRRELFDLALGVEV